MTVLRGDPSGWARNNSDGDVTPSAIAIGVFDGVHTGHVQVLQHTAERASELGGLRRVALTFDRHPRTVVSPDQAPALLTSLEERIELLYTLGIELIGVLPFESVRDTAPEAFVSEVLVRALGARLITVGADFRFGRGRAGDVASLRAAGVAYGFEVDAVELVSADGSAVSSTTIRTKIAEGDVRHAAELLGRPFAISGAVVEGDQRGRTIGFPTANVIPDPAHVVPRRGVYAATVWIDHRGTERHDAVVNIGIRPTFGGDQEVVEAHLLDFDGDLYGRRIGIEMVERLRDERTFEGIDALVAQIRRDERSARQLLGT
jgi:riboflavin kinase/FMN adenylyltransferase